MAGRWTLDSVHRSIITAPTLAAVPRRRCSRGGPYHEVSSIGSRPIYRKSMSDRSCRCSVEIRSRGTVTVRRWVSPSPRSWRRRPAVGSQSRRRSGRAAVRWTRRDSPPERLPPRRRRAMEDCEHRRQRRRGPRSPCWRRNPEIVPCLLYTSDAADE